MNTVTIVNAENDTLSFGTLNADKTGLDGLLIGDSLEIAYSGHYEPGMEALSLTTIAKVRKDLHSRLFEQGIRTEAVDGSSQVQYLLFSPDSSEVELYKADGTLELTLKRRTLPAGGYAWNVEDDATKNVRQEDGLWTVSQRGKLLLKQPQSDGNEDLGPWKESHYEGLLPAADGPGIRYQLVIRHRAYSGDGRFLLRLTYLEAEDGQDKTCTCMGQRYTQRGIPSDNDATVWQLISDLGDETYNFLYNQEGQTLTLLDKDFRRNASDLNYTLKPIK